MEFDEKDLRREISYAIKNIHGVRQVLGGVPKKSRGCGCPLSAPSVPPWSLPRIWLLESHFSSLFWGRRELEGRAGS